MSSPEPQPSLPSDQNPTPTSPPVEVPDMPLPETTPSPPAEPVDPEPVLPPPEEVPPPAPLVPTLPSPLPIPEPSSPPAAVTLPEIVPASPPPPLTLPIPSPVPTLVPVPPVGLAPLPPSSSSQSPTPPSSSSHPSPRSLSPPLTHHGTPPSTSNSNSTTSDVSSMLSRNLPLTIGITAVTVAFLMMLGFGLMYWICARKKKKESPRLHYQMDHPPPHSHAVGVGDLSYRGGSMNPGNRLPPSLRPSPKRIELVPSAVASPSTPGAQPTGFWAPTPPRIPSDKSNMSLSDSFRNGGFSNHSSFTYEELAAATGGFGSATVIGHGGFGYVYKGALPNGREVAIKCLKSGAKQGDREFQAEVEIISRVHHRHLVSLVGYCIEGGQRILVYDFVPNKSLDYHLHGKDQQSVEWGVRLRIALGAAKGLAYLHEDCHPRIIHRDIKASNTLLDMNFEAKVADFGLAKLTTDNYTHVSTRIMGTFGYLAPEYASTGKLTEKSDVFSFGVMLLELITGRRPYDAANKFHEDSLIDWARPEIEKSLKERNFIKLADPRLEGNYIQQEMARMVACAGACIRHSAKLRPKMSQVVRGLERDSALEEMNDWSKLTEPQRSGSSTNYESSSFENTRTTRPPKPALKASSSNNNSHHHHHHHHHHHNNSNSNSNDDSREFVSSEYGGATTSEYGLDPSSSSSSSDESEEITSRKSVKKVDNRLWFHEGWQDFVEHYSIRVGYFLVFRYEGNSIFNIYIFNLTTSEIDYHSNARQGLHYGRQFHVFREMEDDDVADKFGSSSPADHSESLKRKAIGGSSAVADHLGLNRGFNPMNMQTLFNGSMHQQEKSALGSHAGGIRALPDIIAQAGGIKFRNGEDDVKMSSPADEGIKKAKKPRKNWKSVPDQLISGTLLDEESSKMRYRFYASASTRKRTVMTEERERALSAAKIYEPPNPCCRVVVRPSYLYRGCIMYLPSCFAEKHLHGVSGFIKLQLSDGRQWPVRCLYRGGRAKLSQGWYDFSLENNLAEGDGCVFELIRAREVVLKVTLFRVMDEGRLLNPHPHVR